jgi:hypothetical protein
MEIVRVYTTARIFNYLYASLRSLRKDNTRAFNLDNKEVEVWHQYNQTVVFSIGCRSHPIFPTNPLDMFLLDIIFVN